MIFLAMDPLRELYLFGRFSSTVRIPYKVLNRTSSGASPGKLRGISTAVWICAAQECVNVDAI